MQHYWHLSHNLTEWSQTKVQRHNYDVTVRCQCCAIVSVSGAKIIALGMHKDDDGLRRGAGIWNNWKQTKCYLVYRSLQADGNTITQEFVHGQQAIAVASTVERSWSASWRWRRQSRLNTLTSCNVCLHFSKDVVVKATRKSNSVVDEAVKWWLWQVNCRLYVWTQI